MNWVGPPCILPKIILQNAREAPNRDAARQPQISPGLPPPADRLDSKATILQLEISRLEALASAHRNDFEHQRDRNDRAEMLKLTADLMASKEMAARLNGELRSCAR
jgi:hypothetical protein